MYSGILVKGTLFLERNSSKLFLMETDAGGIEPQDRDDQMTS